MTGTECDLIRIVLVDDQELVRAGFRMVLDAQPDMQVVGEAADGAAAIDLARRLHADVMIMDARMPRLDGVEATRQIRQAGDLPRVLMLTTFDADEYVYEALRGGASGFLLKDVRSGQLVEAALAKARAEHLTIVPWCPYAREWLKQHPDQFSGVTVDFKTRPPKK